MAHYVNVMLSLLAFIKELTFHSASFTGLYGTCCRGTKPIKYLDSVPAKFREQKYSIMLKKEGDI